MRTGCLAIAWLAIACTKSQSVQCGDGWVCPPNQACDVTHHLCVDPEQLQTCVDRDDGMDCAIRNEPIGLCRDRVCLPAGCGDGFQRANELCDGAELGAKRDCTQHDFYDLGDVRCNDACSYDTSGCTGFCGDGMVNGPELCDASPPNRSCVDLGYDAGYLDCVICGPDFADCRLLGWNIEHAQTEGFYDVHGTSDSNVYAVAVNTVLRFDGEMSTRIDVSACTAAAAFHGAWVLGDQDAFVVGAEGSDGIVLRITGTTCNRVASPAIGPLFDGWASAANDLFVVGDGIHHFDGATWTSSNVGTPVRHVWGSASNDVYAGGFASLLHYNGTSWSTVGVPGTTILEVTAIWGSAANDVYVAVRTSASGYLVLRYDGADWTRVFTGSPTQIDSIATANGIVFVATLGALHAYVDSEWTNLGADFSAPASGLWAAPSGRVFAATTTGRLFSYHGGAWAADSLPGVLRAVSARSSTQAAVVNNNFDLFTWDGRTWTFDSGAPASSFDVWLDPTNGDIYALDATGLERRPYASSTWSQLVQQSGGQKIIGTSAGIWIAGTSPLGATLRLWTGSQLTCTTCNFSQTSIVALWASGPNDVFAVGTKILHWNGSTWTTMTAPTTEPLFGVWGSGPSDVYAVGNNATVLHFDGSTWTPITLPASVTFSTVSGFGPSDVFVAGDAGVMFHFDGTHWTPVRRQTTAIMLEMAAGGGLLYTTDSGGFVRRLARTVAW